VPLHPRDLLGNLYSAATSAVAPGPALERRLAGVALPPGSSVWVLALGKAAHPMAVAAVRLLSEGACTPAGGLVVGPAAGASPHPALLYLAGDHPEPGQGSLAAADALSLTVGKIRPQDEVWVLLSGGTSSLIAAPEVGISAAELRSIFSLLLGSGLDIVQMNQIRKRFSRWGGGKLARALAPARVRVYIVSDVIGDDLASIGSGPCVPDPATAFDVRQLLERADLWPRIPESARALVLATERGEGEETPKPGDEVFSNVGLELIASNRLALEAAAERARELGLVPRVADVPIAGEAAPAGEAIAAVLREQCSGRRQAQRPTCLIWGGETTVSLGRGPTGVGGRCQELALAAARALDGMPEGVALLAAGTDGRDGPTDAAGAIVDGATWRAIGQTGRDPGGDLAVHDAYRSLDAAGALIRPGLTGTNVMDVVIGVCLEQPEGQLTDESRAAAGSRHPG
jgi:glycerate 2-kinase